MRLTIHGAGWFGDKAIGKLAEKLWARGFAFDYISDRQLAGAKAVNGRHRCARRQLSRGGRARVRSHAAGDARKLLALAEAGATVIFEGHLPTDVPGLGGLEQRRAELQKLLARIKERAVFNCR